MKINHDVVQKLYSSSLDFGSEPKMKHALSHHISCEENAPMSGKRSYMYRRDEEHFPFILR